MKTFCSLLLGVLFAFGAAGCTPPQANPAAQNPAPPETETDAGKEIFLTFDDGPTDSVTPLVLDVLQKEGVRATFFLIGRQVAGREGIVQRIAAEGHAIGIHSYSHVYSEIYASPAALLRDIERCTAAIRTALPGYEPTLYRFPGGSFAHGEDFKRAVKALGLRAYDWNAATYDATTPLPDAGQQYNNAVESAAGRRHIILLQHDCVGQQTTAECLPRIIAHYRERGYTFKILSNQKSAKIGAFCVT